MNYLLIDTTKDVANIIAKYNDVEYVSNISSPLMHNENLLLKIENILDMAKCKLSDFDAFAVVTGPGSFTGIRVGISTCKAFCLALKKHAFSFTNFDALKGKYSDCILLIPCTHTSVYFYDTTSDTAKVVSDTNLDTSKKYCVLGATDKTRFDKLHPTYVDDYTRILFDYAEEHIANNGLVDSNQIEPYYLELSQAEREQNAKDSNKAGNKG